MSRQRLLDPRFWLTVALVLGLAACAAPPTLPPPTATALPTPAPTVMPTPAPTQGPITKVFDIGGRRLFLQCVGAGSPTVLLEAGGGQSSSTWSAVMPALSAQTRVCAYDRAGLGLSDPPAVVPVTSQDIVRDLHKLLAVAGVTGPYVLVGHSLGGFHVRVFAAEYPAEVVGVVLVDGSHPDQVQAFLDSLPPAQPDDPPEWQTYRAQEANNDPAANVENLDFAASAAQVRASGNLGDRPLAVVTANPQGLLSAFGISDAGVDLGKRISQTWLRLQAELVHLSTRGTQVIATTGGHFVQIDQPQLVIDATQQVVQAARTP